MDKKEIKKALKELEKFEREFWRAESNISTLANYIQPFFDFDIKVVMSSDGAAITYDGGKIGFVEDFLNAL